MDKGGSRGVRERTSNSAELAQLIETVTAKQIHMRYKSELRVQGDTKVTYNIRESKERESCSECRHIQPSQLLACAQPDKLSLLQSLSAVDLTTSTTKARALMIKLILLVNSIASEVK